MSGRTLLLQSGPLDVWAEHWAIAMVHNRPSIGRIDFDDTEHWHDALLAAVLDREHDPRLAEPKAGGHRTVADLTDWDVPEAELIALRATKLCRALMNTQAVALHEATALIVRNGQAIPHAEPPDVVAMLTYVLAGPAPLLFTHAHVDDTRFKAPDDTRPGSLFACPGAMVLSTPYVQQSEATVLLQFGFRAVGQG